MKIQSILMKKHMLLIIFGGILLISGLVLSLNKKKNIIYITESLLSQEEATNLVAEKIKNVMDIYERQSDIFNVVTENNTVVENQEEQTDLPVQEDLYIKVSNYDEVVDKLFSKEGKEELEKITFNNNPFVKKAENDVYILKEIPISNQYSNSSISVGDVYINTDEVKAKIAFTSDAIDSNDVINYYIFEKQIEIVKVDDNWVVKSFNYLNY